MVNLYLTPLRKKYQWMAAILLLVFASSGCMKDHDFDFDRLEDKPLHTNIAASLINSRVFLSDLLKDTTGIIQVNPDESITLHYNTDESFSSKANEIIKIQDQSLNFEVKFDPPPRALEFEKEEILPLDFGENDDIRLDSLYFKGSKFMSNISIAAGGSGEITFLNILDANKNPLVVYAGNGNEETTVDLDGYQLTQADGQSNVIKAKIKISFPDNVDPTGLLGTTILEGKIELKEIAFEKLYGYVGYHELLFEEETEINLFKNAIEGQIDFEKILISFLTENSFSCPMKLTIQEVIAYKKDVGTPIEDLQKSFELNYPSIDNLGEAVSSPNLENIPSEQLIDAIMDNPDRMVFKIKAEINPDKDPSKINAILAESGLKLKTRMQLPLTGSISRFKIQDTINMDLKDVDNLADLHLKLNTANAFPLNVNMQIYFVDSTYKVLDSLFNQAERPVLKAGITDPDQDYKVVQPTDFKDEIPIYGPRIEALKKADFLILNAYLQSYKHETQPIKVYNNSYLDLKLGIKSQIEF